MAVVLAAVPVRFDGALGAVGAAGVDADTDTEKLESPAVFVALTLK